MTPAPQTGPHRTFSKAFGPGLSVNPVFPPSLSADHSQPTYALGVAIKYF